MSGQTETLKSKINEFIRKYYLNRLLKGLLVGIGIWVLFFLFINLIEYFGYLGKTGRAVLFFGFIGTTVYVLYRYIAVPILKMAGIGKVMSQEEASGIIGNHFPEISDKLLNALQLGSQAEHSDNELLIEGINQKIKALNPFVFTAAVDFQQSIKRYARYTLLPLLLLIGILVFQSSMITKPTERILSFGKEFVKEAPFRFVLEDQNLNIIKNSEYKMTVKLVGKEIPAELYVNLDDHLIKMESVGNNKFEYLISHVTSDHQFYFTDGEYNSFSYTLNVMPQPSLSDFEVDLQYPKYTGRQNEVLKNTGDFTVPEGTKVKWTLRTKDVDSLHFIYQSGKSKGLASDKEGTFQVELTVLDAFSYGIVLYNEFVSGKDTLKYRVNTIPDRFPGIAAEQTKDSVNPYKYYFYGKADDDYGLSHLRFVHRIKDRVGTEKYLPVNIGKGTDEIFYYMVDLRDLTTQEGVELEYYFEVWDNDAIHGKKSSKSQVFHAIKVDDKELRKEAEAGNSSLKNSINSLMKEIENVRKKGNEMKRELTQSSEFDWQKQQKLKEYIDEQKRLQKKLEELKQANQLLNEKENQRTQLDEELLRKQQELEKLFESLMTPETQDLLKKLEEMLKKQKNMNLKEEMEKMDRQNEDMSKQLDRNLEQLKKFELEKRMQDEINELNKLAEKQKELAEKTENKSASQEELKKEQEEINKKFDELKEEMEKTKEKNEDLESPLNLDDMKEEQSKVEKNLEESSESLEKKQNKKASQKQNEASDQMNEMAEKMKKSLEEAKKEQESEDYYTLRQILENLIELSVEQEDLMDELSRNNSYNPKYVELGARQRKLKGKIQQVEDSLHALSKRQVHIQTFVNKEIQKIDMEMDLTIESVAAVDMRVAGAHQQYVMTGLNNLALMLSESLKKMQEDMKSKSKSSQSCDNPGNKGQQKPGKNSGKPKAGGLKSLQEKLNEDIKNLQKKQQSGGQSLSEEYAKIAARQEAIRRELEKLEKMLKEEGNSGALGDLQKTKDLMEQQEKDIVNKKLNSETVRRMEQIETRMLEHEKAEQEQELDNEREAEQAQETENSMPPAMKEYLEKKAREMELLRSVPSELSPYYKDRVRIYFQQLGSV